MHGYTCDIDQLGVARITLNRPECHNAFDADLIRNLSDDIEQLQKNSAVRLLVLQGEGKCFSAGADLRWMQASRDYSVEENLQDALELAELMKNLDHFNKPSIAVINGPAFGGALGLIACCDIALATDNAVFCFSEVKLGLIPAVISPYILRAIGQRQARRYFLTAEKFDAKQALNMGFIHDIIQTSELVTAPQKLIHQCLNNGPQALIAAKELIRKVAYHAIDEDLFRETAMLIAKIRVSDEAQAGLAAFFAKQTPDWIKDEKN